MTATAKTRLSNRAQSSLRWRTASRLASSGRSPMTVSSRSKSSLARLGVVASARLASCCCTRSSVEAGLSRGLERSELAGRLEVEYPSSSLSRVALWRA